MDVVQSLVVPASLLAVGSALTLVVQTVGNRAAIGESRRSEAVDLVARFWAAADRLWHAEQSLTYTVHMQMAERDSEWVTDERRMEVEQARQKGIQDVSKANEEARTLAGQLRIVFPDLADQTTDLLETSARYEVGGHSELRDARQRALDAFETAARQLIARK